MKNNTLKKFAALSMACTTALTMSSALSAISVSAAETNDGVFPYTMFASSDSEGAITINSKHFCMNGSMASNGTISTSKRTHINGSKTENAAVDMPFVSGKINNSYFSNAMTADDYSVSDHNVNMHTTMDVTGEASISGNINMSSSIKADDDININGNVCNINNSVIYSEFGDVIIDSNNVNLTGMIYAPLGDVVITGNNINLNNTVIIADTITLNANNVNANYGRSYAQTVGTESETKSSYITKYNSYLMDKEADNILDMLSQYYTVTPVDAGEFSNIAISAPLAPGFIVNMDFEVQQYDVEGYGNLSIMKTDGFQQMSTIVLTPYNKDLPLISTDYMFNGESRLSYIEFYGLGIDGDENMPVFDSLSTLPEKYKDFVDQPPTPGWFDEVRTMGLFKVSNYKSDDAIENMLYDSFKMTLDASMVAPELDAAQKVVKHDMIQNYVDNLIANPGISTAIFNMCLGQEKTRCFFNDVFFGPSKYIPENN